MRKPLIVVLCMALLVIYTTVAAAEDKTQVDVYENQELIKSVVFVIGQDQYFINNETPGIKMDAAPFIEAGRTFVPIRYLSNALGVEDEYIGWESPRVGLNQPGMPVVELAVGSKQIKSDGQAKTMDVAPLLKESRTYLPARFVAEALGYQVAWDAANQVVLAYPKGTEKPDVSNVIDYIGGKKVPQEPVDEQPVEVQPIEPEPPKDAKVIDLQGKGEPVTNYEFAKYLKPTSKINWLTYEEFNSNSYEVNGVQTHGMRVTKDKVYITQTGGCGGVGLYEGGDILRPRSSSGPTWDKYEYGYTVVLDSTDQYGGWPTCDIAKVSHIFLDGNNGMFLAIENPLYKGGK